MKTEPEPPRFWCNFCDFRTDDRNAYLAHRCTEILESTKQDVPPRTDKNCR